MFAFEFWFDDIDVDRDDGDDVYWWELITGWGYS